MKQALRLLATLIIAPLAFMSSALGQNYPVKPIRVILGFPAGSTTDIAARLVSSAMQKPLNQSLIVDPRPGAQGAIGGAAVAKADPDGYTLYFGTVVNLTTIFTKNNPIDASKEFTPVSDSMNAPLVLFISGKLPANNFQEFVAYAKSQPPGKLNNGLSSPQQNLMSEVIKSATGITFTTIPYTALTQYMPGLTAGEIAFTVNLFANFRSQLESGAVRAMFITAPKRSSQYPNVPTSAEVGLPGFEYASFAGGFWAPRGTSAAIVGKLSPAAIAAVNAPETVEQFRKVGYDPVGTTPEEQLRNFDLGVKFWAHAAKISNYQPQ